MRLSHVLIENFRSLQSIDVSLAEDYSTLIGKNDCGKSSFLAALQRLFDPAIPVSSTDFCAFAEGAEGNDPEMIIQATLTDCWHEKAKNGDFIVRRVVTDYHDQYYFQGPVPRLPILKNMSQGVGTRKDLRDDTTMSLPIKAYAEERIRELEPKGTVPPDSWIQLFNDIVANHPVDFEEGWHIMHSTEIERLVNVVFLPADIRGEEEVSNTGRTTFERIGRFILGSTEDAFPDISDARERLNEEILKASGKDDEGKWLFERLNEFELALSEEIERIDPSVRAVPSLLPPTLPPLDFELNLKVSDEWVDTVSQLGHGMRRSIVFAMLRANRRLEEFANGGEENRPIFIFLVEEPEIYLHPQSERRRMAQLRALSEDPNAQVLVCTHSSFFVNLADFKGIFRLARTNRKETSIRGWNGGDLALNEKKILSLVHRFDPAKAAMFFADLVILVEGQCESDAIPVLAERLNIVDPAKEVEVVDCHGNENIPVFQRVLEGFGIPYVAWPDADVAAVVAKIYEQRNPEVGKVVVTNHDWETMNALPRGDKVVTSWRYFVFDESLPNQELERRIRAAFQWVDYPNPPAL